MKSVTSGQLQNLAFIFQIHVDVHEGYGQTQKLLFIHTSILFLPYLKHEKGKDLLWQKYHNCHDK